MLKTAMLTVLEKDNFEMLTAYKKVYSYIPIYAIMIKANKSSFGSPLQPC